MDTLIIRFIQVCRRAGHPEVSSICSEMPSGRKHRAQGPQEELLCLEMDKVGSAFSTLPTSKMAMVLGEMRIKGNG